MKIGIIGTRGIPNHYGGFEQCAEHIAKKLAEKGHQVLVYNSHNHPYKKSEWKGVQLIHCYDPESSLGTFGQFIYDFNCLRDARKRNFDVLLQLGYTSNAIWFPLWPKNCPNVINMDGMEWKRSKYNKWVKKFLRYSEYLAATHANLLIADSLEIQAYLKKQYQFESYFVPYGGIPFDNADPSLLPKPLLPYKYDLLIARMEKENNVEKIIKAFLASESDKHLVIVGNYEKAYGRKLYHTYSNETGILFLGGIFDVKTLNNLRYFSHLYYHGHSVGGTNPSLIEAMAGNAMILAHKNNFNQKVLGTDAFYFSDGNELLAIIKEHGKTGKREDFIKNNLKKVKDFYNWERITALYEETMVIAVEDFNTIRQIKNQLTLK